jgi:two-component system, chemotaxis family, sensor kinase CheA
VPNKDAISVSDDFPEYVAECDEHFAIARGILLPLESSAGEINPARLDELFRNFHTIKGLSGMVGIEEAQELAHEVESFLVAVRKQSSPLNGDGIDLVLTAIQKLEEIIAAHRDGRAPPETDQLIARISQLHFEPVKNPRRLNLPEPDPAGVGLPRSKRIQLEAAMGRGESAWRVMFTPSPELAARGISVNSVRERLQAAGEIIHAEPAVVPGGGIRFSFVVASKSADFRDAFDADGSVVSSFQLPTDSSETGSHPSPLHTSLASATLVRVDLGRLDDLMRSVGELVITRSRLESGLGRVQGLLPPRDSRELEETCQAMERHLRELREGVMRVRLVPVRDAFARMRLVVRELSRTSGKDVRLILIGEETEIDKFVVERVADPLLHLVRNAVSHGVEMPGERVAVGKPAQAQLHLRAVAGGGAITIGVEDDGRGIDTERIFARARAAGIVAADALADPSAVLDLICMPGFSTQESADRASGRGVGMDVVRRTIEQLGGTLAMSTQLGVGTRFTARMPVTLAIADALIIEVGGQAFAIPQTAVREVVQVGPDLITKLERNELLRHHGGVLPLLRLADVFGGARKVGEFPALIIGETGNTIALAADRLLGLREIVVRRLVDSLVQVPGLAGATELGDGRAILILDATSLARYARAGRWTSRLEKVHGD